MLSLVILAIASVEARTFVLVTGVSNYEGTINDLGESTKDAKRFKEVMETQTKDIIILTSRYVTKDNVLEKLRAICNRAQKGDRIIFYYSGHGTPGAICGYDQNISYDALINELSKSEASEKICFIDACHAGTMANSKSDDSWKKSIKGASDQAFFVSCRGDEISAENHIVGAGLFTNALLYGLRGKADKNQDKQVSIIELFKYIYGDVVKRTQKTDYPQHPQLIAPESMYDKVVSKW